jgi:DNA-directed RNA polymerase subunit M
MKFCDECGSMMKTDDDVWVCKNGHEELRDRAAEAEATTTQGQQQSSAVDMSDVDDAEIGPTTRVQCANPDCDNDRARYEMKQIRSADESETRFFTCTECGRKWREDDH